MKALNLFSRQLPKHAYRKATQEHLTIPNILNRQFAATAPNQIWYGDVSFIWPGNRWAYLVVVIDLFARKPIGWAMSLSPDSNLTCQALTMAFEYRGQPKNVMFHRDQGCHYTAVTKPRPFEGEFFDIFKTSCIICASLHLSSTVSILVKNDFKRSRIQHRRRQQLLQAWIFFCPLLLMLSDIGHRKCYTCDRVL